MLKNTASQKLTIFAFDYSTNAPKTGDAANITAYVSIDDGVLTALTDTSATELDATNGKGVYTFDLTQAETNGTKLVFTAKSSTANVSIVPQIIYTQPANFPLLSVDSNGRVDLIKIAGTTQTAGDIIGDTNDIQARLPAALTADGNIKADTLRVGGTLQTAGDLAALLATIAAYVDTEVAAIKAKTDNLPVDPADASDIAASFASVTSTLATIAAYIDTEVAAIKAKTDNLPASPAATSDIPSAASIASAVLTTQMTESYAANGIAPTLTQAMFAVHGMLMTFAIAGTSYTVKKLDGSTTAFVVTLDDATNPTAATRS